MASTAYLPTLAWRSLRARPLRTGLTTFAVVLGVAAIIAVQVSNRSTLNSIVELFDEAAGKAHLVVMGASASRSGFPASALRQVAATPGVAVAAPSLHIQTALADDLGGTGVSLGFFVVSIKGLLLYGIDPALDGYARQYNMVAGRFLAPDSTAYEVVLVRDYAEARKIRVGSDLAILTPGGVERLHVVGLMAKEGPGRLNNGDFGVLPLATAQEIFGRSGDLDQIDVVATPAASSQAALDALKATLQARLGDAYSVTYPATQGKRVAQMLDAYEFGLSFFSAIALFVGAFLIYNAFSMTVVERTREIGLLRAVGMTRRQILALVLIEAGLLGLIGSALGIAAGMGLANGLTRVMALFVNQEIRTASPGGGMLATGALVGIGATLLAATVPAWQASTISPLEALRIRGNRRESWLVRRGWPAGLAVVVLSLSILFGVYFILPTIAFRLGPVAVFGLLVGVALMLPATIGPWERVLRPLLRRLYGNEGRLGSSNVLRARLRTALTSAALMIGLAMVLSIRSMTGSFVHDISTWIEAYLGSDLYVYSTLPLSADLGKRLAEIEGMAGVTPVRFLSSKIVNAQGGRDPIVLMFVDPATHGQISSFVFAERQADADRLLAELGQGEMVFVSSALAEKYALRPGDKVRLETRRGLHDFTVAAVVIDFYNRGMVAHGSWRDMRRYFGTNQANAYLLKVAPGYPVEQVRDRIEALYGRRRQLSVESNQALKDRAYQLAERGYRMFDVLGLIAVIVASFGIVNTLTMNVTERTREIGALRGLGMTRWQVRRMILAEAALMGAIGGVLGLVFGLLLSVVFLRAIWLLRGYELTFVPPLQSLVVGLIMAPVISQLAAIWPAQRAARLRIVEAIQYE